MARARNLKPSFFKDAKVVGCSFPARLLFQGLWCLSDYMGRLKYVPIEVKMELFPADDVDVQELMGELEKCGLIDIYPDNSGSALVQVLGFAKHQNPHINEKQDKDKNPLPCLPSKEDVKNQNSVDQAEKKTVIQLVEDAIGVLLDNYQSVPAESLFPLTESLLLIPDSGTKDQSPKAGDSNPVQQESNPPDSKKKTKRTKFPDDLMLTEKLKSSAIAYWSTKGRPDIDPQDQFQQFRAHHIAKGSLMDDWSYAWQTWYCNAIKFTPRLHGYGTSQSSRPVSEIDRVNAAISRRAAQREQEAISNGTGIADLGGDFMEASDGALRLPVHPAVRS